MRVNTIVMAFAAIFVVLVGLQFLPGQIVGADVSVSVDVRS